MNTFVQCSSLGVQKMTKSIQFYRRKKTALSKTRTKWPILVGSGSKSIYFTMQNDLRLHHSRTEWPFAEQLDRKWTFYRRAEEVFSEPPFQRDCRPFLEGCAPAGPPMGILDESCEGFSAKSQKPLENTRKMVLPGVI